jgi:hypothetical protein
MFQEITADELFGICPIDRSSIPTGLSYKVTIGIVVVAWKGKSSDKKRE